MVIYLIRHSMPDVASDVCYGQTDVKLLRWHLERTAKRLKKQVLAGANVNIFSSPSKRCVQLARAISRGPCRIKVDRRLSELNFGNWEMKSWDDIEDEAMLKWAGNFIYEQVPGGESYAQLYERVCDFWKMLTDKNSRDEEAIICTHSGVIKAILTHILEMPLKNSLAFKFRYGDTIRVELSDHQQYQVEFMPRDY